MTATIWTKEQLLEGAPAIKYNENTATLVFLIDNVFEFLIDSTYKLLIGDSVPSYNDLRYNYNGKVAQIWSKDSKNTSIWTKEIPTLTTWTNETKI